MTLREFRQSLDSSEPPPGLTAPLQALWYDARGNWKKAHAIAQDCAGKESAWVHAYLHRKEGDESNARYWYSRAGREPSGSSLEQEWTEIVTALLKTR